MATTQNEHNGNGTTRRFSFTFPYIKEDDVKVSLRTSTANVTDIASNTYTFPSATEIQFSAVTATTFQESTGAPKTGVTVRIFRDTDLDTERVTFFPGSSIRAQDLNDNTLQNLYASQERQNRAVDSTGGTMTGDLLMLQSDIRFEGATADDFETTLTVTDPTADRTITFPDRTGNVILSSDTNTVTSTMVDGSLVDANIAANAEIAVSKLGNGTARQVLQTDAAGTGVEFTSNVDLPGTLDVTGAAVFDSSVTATTFSGNATSSSVLTPGRNIGGVAFDGSADINLAGVNVQGNQDTTGNAATATALQTARTIAGQSFDGTGNITIAPTDLTGVTSTAAEINQLDGIDLIPTSPTWTSATEIPSNSQISDRIAELGGFEAIATEDDFPATAPPEGVVVSIGNANALSVSAGGVGAGTRAGGSDPVVINGFPSEFNSTTLDNGIGLVVVATSTAHTYDFHRVLAKNEDVRQLSSDIDDFKARYRVGTTNPTADLDTGDLFYNTSTNKMLVYDGSAWTEVQSVGEYFIIPAAELADFADGSASVETISNAPNNAEQIILSINGVIQEPNAGTAVPTDGFSLNGAVIQLADTPPNPSEVWGVIIGSSVNINEPSANSVSTVKIQDDAVTYAKMQDISTGNRVLGRATAGEIQEVQVATDMIADDAVTYAKMQNLANANRVLGAAAAGEIGETQVQSAMIIDDVALGGNPTTTTQTAGNNTTRIATTAFVTTAVGAVNTDLVNDTTPQLGGNLDVNGNQIVSASNGDISIQPN
ncbi:MAG: phage tail fiber domain-containing protein, partial [Candidatus Thorarchaeota archaeon]